MRFFRWLCPAAAALAIAAAGACTHVVDETSGRERDPARVWEESFRRGWNLYLENRHEFAERRYLAALNAARHFPDDDPRTLRTRVAIALVYRAQRRFEEAEAELVAVLPLQRRVTGTSSEPVAEILDYLGGVYLDQERFDAAEFVLLEALRIRVALHGTDAPLTAVALQNVATAIREQDRLEEALPIYLHAFRSYARGGEEWLAHAASVQNQLGLLHRAMGDPDEAEAAHLAAIQLTRRVNATRNPNLALYSRDLARLYVEQARYEEARAWFDNAVKMFLATLGAESPQLRETLLDYGEMLEKSGHPEEARAVRESIAPVPP